MKKGTVSKNSYGFTPWMTVGVDRRAVQRDDEQLQCDGGGLCIDDGDREGIREIHRSFQLSVVHCVR
ncbi:hypothetical protein M407DRAFT_246307 [Tulasnella calospora MUT 4182]|uniref:Uncharacterized protein n=1 Tax=Tulasnella calospora MUT 4182 TaxID=1051891 RepID=A0A0C3Q5V0_9AGAM|nr:hypothetical protein M407DRAFT_246307 [Tulasnella calospora MUT 4182]